MQIIPDGVLRQGGYYKGLLKISSTVSQAGSVEVAPVLQTSVVLRPGVGAVRYHGPHNHLQIPLLCNI